MKLTIGFFFIFATSTSYAAQMVKVCGIGTRPSRSIAIVRDSKIAETHIYYLRQGGKRSPLFGDPEQSRGSSVIAECAGKKVRALVVSGEFTANALQGFVMTYSPRSRAPERLDFAEKSRPQWLYLGAHEIIAVIPTWGYGEPNAKYVAYHHVVGRTGADQVDAINRLPPPPGFEVVNLQVPQPPAFARPVKSTGTQRAKARMDVR